MDQIVDFELKLFELTAECRNFEVFSHTSQGVGASAQCGNISNGSNLGTKIG